MLFYKSKALPTPELGQSTFRVRTQTSVIAANSYHVLNSEPSPVAAPVHTKCRLKYRHECAVRELHGTTAAHFPIRRQRERERNTQRRKTETDVKNMRELVRPNICFGRPGVEGRRSTSPLTCIQRSPSVLTVNLNGVGVIMLSPPPAIPLPDENPAFLPDTASYKQSGQFPPLDIGKGDWLVMEKSGGISRVL